MRKTKLDKQLDKLSLEQLLVYLVAVIITTILLVKELFLPAVIVILIATTFVFILSLPTVKGKIGEKKVEHTLKKIAKKHNGYLINNVIIPNTNGATCQIDHILFLESGIYVVETKSYAGRVYGNDNQDQWTQVLSYGKVKNKLYSPVKQNFTHIYCLKSILKKDNIYQNIVIFANNNISYIDSNFVFTRREMSYLDYSAQLISRDELLKMYSQINEYKENPIASNKEHIENIHQAQQKIENNICPRCGGSLVLRQSKNGNFFYGCSSYPNCKFTKNID